MPRKSKFCTVCGTKKPIYKRWWFWVIIVVVVLSLLAGTGEGENESESTTETGTEQSIEYIKCSVSEMIDNLEKNALNAKELYEDKYVEITGRVDVIDASGEYICLYPVNDKWALTSVQCFIKNEEQTNYVKSITTGDILTLRGKVTMVGEVLGYSLNIHEFVD